MFKYLSKALVNRWNMLALAAGAGFSLLSGHADIFLPLVAAAEMTYLSLLGTHPKFQKYVDAQEAAGKREQSSASAAEVLQHIVKQLPQESLSRYERLRARCAELRQLANDMRRTASLESGAPFESLQLAGLERLMWIFMRLLFTQFSLARFLERTSVDRIKADIKQLEAKLKQLPADRDAAHTQKMQRALQDNLQTSQERLQNYEKAIANSELVGLELDRLENRIRSLAEMAINRQEPDFISSQVDQVAKSMVETEKTMNDLQFATGLAPADEQVPELMQYPPVQVVR